MNDVDFGLLGPFSVRRAGKAVPINSPKHRVILAALLRRANRPVSASELAEAVWGTVQPENPRRALTLHVIRLRALLAMAGSRQLIVTASDGYLIRVDRTCVDLLRFEDLLSDARDAQNRSDLEGEMDALVHALALWRGEPLADVPSDALHREVVPALQRQWIQAQERRIEIGLELGKHIENLDALFAMTARFPLRERPWIQLITTLNALGRRSEALEAFQKVRDILSNELGVEPGDELQALHLAVLSGFQREPSGLSTAPIPRQLPPSPRGFVGRASELRSLDRLLTETEPEARGGRGVIVTITGMAGVGKSSLAAYWARRIAERFADGQMWVNLRGYHPGQTLTSQQAISRMIRALGLSDAQIPADLDEQIGLYRSLMDGRRMLIVLDNAHDAEQVRPLLPGTPGTFTVVTSRGQLSGLVAAEAAHPLVLGLPTPTEAKDVLVARLGKDVVAGDPDAVERIVNRCGRLPLALVVVAARVTAQPALSLSTVADKLSDPRGDLDVLATRDTSSDLRSAFSWSYNGLAPSTARAFRLLGLHPGTDIGLSSAAAIADLEGKPLRSALSELCDAHLLSEQVPQRYAFHDLLRSYAVELVSKVDSHDERRMALLRLLDYFLQTAERAVLQLNPSRVHIEPVAPQPGVRFDEFTSPGEADQWFGSEQPALLMAIKQADEVGYFKHAWQLAWLCTEFLNRRGLWRDMLSSNQIALRAARQSEDLVGQVVSHRSLGGSYANLGLYQEARIHAWRSLRIARGMGDHLSEAFAHRLMAWLCERQERFAMALRHAMLEVQLCARAGSDSELAMAYNSLGWCHALVGDYVQSLSYCERALRLLEQLDNRVGQAHAWDSLGYAHDHLGNLTSAVSCFESAVRIFADLGNRYQQARVLIHLGDAYHSHGSVEAARRTWETALDILSEIRHYEAGDLKKKLDRLP